MYTVLLQNKIFEHFSKVTHECPKTNFAQYSHLVINRKCARWTISRGQWSGLLRSLLLSGKAFSRSDSKATKVRPKLHNKVLEHLCRIRD